MNQNLNCVYNVYKKSWMIGITWFDWIAAFKERMMAEGRKLVLIIDNAHSHNGNFEFKYLKVIFLPSNATFCTQPMDTGLIRGFKASYMI